MDKEDAFRAKRIQAFIDKIKLENPTGHLDDEEEDLVIIDSRPHWGTSAVAALVTSLMLSPLLFAVVVFPVSVGLSLFHIKLMHREALMLTGFLLFQLWLGVFILGYWPRPYIGMRRKR